MTAPARPRSPFVTAAAFLAAFGAAGLPTGVQAAIPRSVDDRGFSIALVSPTDPYLTGRQTLKIEPIIPRGDAIEQVDFFVDGKLVFVTHGEPYSCQSEFGGDMRRHMIEVRALTEQGRRAKVSFVSRSVDVAEGAVSAVATIPVVVRNDAGSPVSTLGVSDFVLQESGAPRSIVHFAPGPTPASLALVLDDRAREEHAEEALATFLRGLPAHQSVALVDDEAAVVIPPASTSVPATPPGSVQGAKPAPGQGAKSTPGPAPPGPPPFPFLPDPEVLAARLQSGGLDRPSGSLAGRVTSAARALETRRGPRVLLLLVGLEPPAPAPPPAALPPAPPATSVETPAAGHAAPREKPGPAGDRGATAPAEDPLVPALEEALAVRAAIYVIALGSEGSPSPEPLHGACERSGGQYILASDAPGLAQAFRIVGDSLRHRYLLTFIPADPERAGWRTLDLAVRAPELTVQAPRALHLP